MVDLSQVQGRQTDQDLVTRNRPETIRVPDQPDAPKVAQTVSLRDSIPDSQASAAAVRQVLGLANDTLNSFNQNQTAKMAQQDQTDAAKGVADQGSGQVDPTLEKRSLAYSLAVGMANAQDVALKAHVQATQDATEYLAQNPHATLDDLNDHMNQVFRSLILDQDGHPVDFGHPEATAFLYKQLQATRAQVLEQGATTIHHQMQEIGAGAYDDEVKAAVMGGQPPDVEAYIGNQATLGIDAKAAKARLINTLRSSAMMTKDASVLSLASANRRADGTPSFNPQEQTALLESYHVLSSQFRTEHEQESREASAGILADSYVSMLQGKVFTPQEYQQLRQQGLRPEDVDNLVALQDRVKDRQWAAQRQGWALQEHAQAMQNYTWTNNKRSAQEAGASFLASAYAAGASPGDMRREAVKGFNAGSFDAETFDGIMKEAGQLPTDGNLIKAARADTYEYVFKQAQDAARAKYGKGPGAAQFTQDQVNAQLSFYRNLRQQQPNEAALRAGLAALHLDPKSIDQAVSTAVGMSGHATIKDMRKHF